MRIGYFGDGPWAHNALELLNNRNDLKILFVCGRFENPDKVLEKKAKDLGIEFFTEKNINTPNFLEKINSYKVDLLVSMSFNQIFKKLIYDIPKYGTINCHAGKLPLYRGRNVLNWVLINDEKEFGITVHFVNDGIDTGDIILQETFEITENDSYKTLLEKAYKECQKILLRSIIKIMNNNLNLIPQKKISDSFMYCSKREVGDEIIEWDSYSRDIFNFIRALTYPGPCATSFINNQKIKIIKASLIYNAPVYIGIPGCIIEVKKDSFLIKTKDSYLKILEWETNQTLKIGLRLKKEV